MNRLKDGIRNDLDEVETFLSKLEHALIRANHGIWLFIVQKIPEFARTFLTWLQEKFTYLCRIAVRVARVVGLALGWLLIVFGPLAIYTSLLTGLWAGVALAGSWWGVQRQLKFPSDDN